jgi:hypothetical protein
MSRAYASMLAFFLLAICPLAGAATYKVRPGLSGADIQNVIDGALAGDTVFFNAGTYNIRSTLILKCGVTYTGPVADPATAEITTDATNLSLTQMKNGCRSRTTIQYLHFNGAGAFYADAKDYSNIRILHNQMTSIPSKTCSGKCQSVFFDGDNKNRDSDIEIMYNTFGDKNSCTDPFVNDDGGCAGVLMEIVGYITNLTVQYNTFYHLYQGMHLTQVQWSADPGAESASCNNCDFEYNYFSLINRIALEDQVSVVNKPTIIANNVFASNNLQGKTWWAMAISAACCVSGRLISSVTNAVPSDYIRHNLIFNSTGDRNGLSLPLAIENQGVNPQVTNNLIQGFICYGIVWSWGVKGYGGLIADNTMQSPLMATRAESRGCAGGPTYFVSNECGNKCGTPPKESGNKQESAPSAVASKAPSFDKPSGAYTFPLIVTLIDDGVVAGPQPQGNTGIWYTTDGSEPVPGKGTAKYVSSGVAVKLEGPVTLKAVGMWGTPPQPTSYPAGYGFVPSGVVSAQYTSGGGAPRPKRPA